MMGSFSRLATETSVIDEQMKSLLHAAGEAVKELYQLVVQRQSGGGVVAQLCSFWMTSVYLDKAKFVKEQVQQALRSLMARCSPKPQPSPLNPQPSNLNPRLSTLNAPPSPLNPRPSLLNPQPQSPTLRPAP